MFLFYLAYGQGGALLQQVNRDTNRFAQKTSAISINGEWIGVRKSPVTDVGKLSKKGRFSLIKQDGEFKTVPYDCKLNGADYLKTVWINGNLKIDHTLEQIRALSEL